MKRFMLGLGVVLMCAGLLATASAADVPFQVEICQVETGTYRVRVEVTGNEPEYIGYVVSYSTFYTFDLVGRVDPGAPQTFQLDVLSDIDRIDITFFYIEVSNWPLVSGDWIPAYSFVLTGPDAAIPECENVSPAGCDQFMPVGPLVTFAEDTPLLWAPDDTALTGYSILAGQTAQMIGSEGQYGQIVWACDVLYVRIEAVTGEAIWQADD